MIDILKPPYHPEETSKIIENASKALLLENISDFRRIRITSETEATFSPLFNIENITDNNIIHDIQIIKSSQISRKSNIENQQNFGISTLLFQRMFPKHNDFFLIDIEDQYFNSLSNKGRSSLINRLIRCIDLSYVLDICEISIISDNPFIKNETTVDIKQISDLFDLSQTEVAHLQLLSIIGTSKEIGNAFDLSPRTIEKMTSNLCGKLNFKNKLDLQLFAKFITSYIDIPYEYVPINLITARNGKDQSQYVIERKI
jgi:DNA-binding CsgD family transcriptional regulator